MTRAMFVTVTMAGKSAYVSGPGSKKLIAEAGGRGLWSRRRRAWATSADVGADVLAVCDARNVPVAFTPDGGGERD